MNDDDPPTQPMTEGRQLPAPPAPLRPTPAPETGWSPTQAPADATAPAPEASGAPSAAAVARRTDGGSAPSSDLARIESTLERLAAGLVRGRYCRNCNGVPQSVGDRIPSLNISNDYSGDFELDFFVEITSSTTSQIFAIVNGLEITRYTRSLRP